MTPSTADQPQNPVRAPWWRRLFSWRAAGRGLAALAALATLIALFYAEEDWRGSRAWARYKSELEAKGEKLDYKDYIPPPVPDAQNFAMTPFLAPLSERNPWPLQPGQSIWRDTNGFDRAEAVLQGIEIDFLSFSLRPDIWNQQRVFDLPSALPKVPGATNAAGRTRTNTLSRAEAAVEILRELNKIQPVLDELRAASQRPYARFNISYTNGFVLGILLPHLSVVRGIASAFQARALAELELGQKDTAFSDMEMALYLGESIKDEPFLIDQLVHIAVFQNAIQAIWEGLARRQWSEPQLANLESRFGRTAFLTYGVLRGERAANLRATEQCRTREDWEGAHVFRELNELEIGLSFAPGGWFSLAESDIARFYQEFVIRALDAGRQRVDPSRAIAGDEKVAQGFRGGASPLQELPRMWLPPVAKSARRIAYGQNTLNLARVACALERYRLANGQFPETLAALSPRFLAVIPHDIMNGEPLKYRRLPEGTFILYSVGWNEKDDGGQIVRNSGTTPGVDLTRGDWVWQYPK